jgi:hypothetical protein
MDVVKDAVQVAQNEAGSPIFVSVGEYRKVPRLDVRHYFYPDASGVPAPTQKGVNLLAEDTLALLEAIEAVETAVTGDPIPVDTDVRNPIFVSRSMYRGVLRLDVRHYYDDRGNWQPTRKGISLPMAEREQLVAAIRSAAPGYLA